MGNLYISIYRYINLHFLNDLSNYDDDTELTPSMNSKIPIMDPKDLEKMILKYLKDNGIKKIPKEFDSLDYAPG